MFFNDIILTQGLRNNRRTSTAG